MRLNVLGCFLAGATIVFSQAAPNLDSVRVRLGSTTYPRRAMDSQGGTVMLPGPPKRIVSLSGGTDEYLYQVVPGEQVAGVSSSSYDEQFSAVLPKVNAHHPGIAKDLDSILKLKPDLILTTDSTSPDTVNALRDAGIPVFRLFTNVTKLVQVAANIAVIGYLTGNDEGARIELARFQREISEIATQCQAPHPAAQIYGVSMTGFSYGDQTLFQDIIRLVGGVNIAARNGMHTYDRVDLVTVAKWNPEWVFTWSIPGKSAQELKRWLDDPELGATSAAKNRHVVVSEAKDVLPLSPLVTTFARTIANATCNKALSR